ncbi:hypothetical protein GOBAR_DD23592 [Gossypium barbadense]|nr:hypothetical protein GOBAR_DD23592 [Gossypium barbadense]
MEKPCSFAMQMGHDYVKPNSSGTERVCFGFAAVFFEGGSEASDEGIEASPSLAERARAWGRGIRVAEERAKLSVDFGFPKLVEVAEELQDVCAAAAGQGERRAVVAEVLPERVPVTALLVFVATEGLQGNLDSNWWWKKGLYLMFGNPEENPYMINT